jgi:hypothetical protein
MPNKLPKTQIVSWKIEVAEEEIEVQEVPAPWDKRHQIAIRIPYYRSDGRVARTSPTLPLNWLYAATAYAFEKGLFSSEQFDSLWRYRNKS